MISLKKLLTDNETAHTLMRVVQLLLQGIALHTVEGDSEDYARFRESIAQVGCRLEEEISSSEALAQAGAVLKALDEYNRRTSNYVRLQNVELQAIVKMLTSTVGAIALAGDQSVRQLQEIEKQVASASQLEDVRLVRAKLSDCLEDIRRETERQRTETGRTVERLVEPLRSGLVNALPSA